MLTEERMRKIENRIMLGYENMSKHSVEAIMKENNRKTKVRLSCYINDNLIPNATAIITDCKGDYVWTGRKKEYLDDNTTR
jgi:hypothetical protein